MSALVLLLSAHAHAQDVRVVVITAGEGEPMADRLQAELRGVGLVPVVLVRAPSEDGVALDLDVARLQSGAVAAFEVVSALALVRVSVPQPGALGPITADLRWAADDPVAAAMVGVEAVEILRAGLMEAQAGAIGSKRAARMSLAELALAMGRPGGRRTSFSLGTRATVGTLSAGPQASVDLGLAVPVYRRLSVAAGVGIPVARARYDGPPGVVHFGVGRVDLGAQYRFRDVADPWVPDVGASVGLALLGFAYEPGPLFLGEDERRVVRPMASIRSGLTSPRVGPVGARAEVRVDGSAPVKVQLEREPVGSWGPLSVGVGLSVDVLL